MEIVTYIDHSGYLLETDDTYFLFDYYKGEIPKLDSRKNIVVFVSHKHADHYNSEIFQLIKEYNHVIFILAKGTPVKRNVIAYAEETPSIDLASHIILAAKNMTFEIILSNHKILKVTTLKSTDLGVAFLLEYDGRTYYHAGDLNLWLWEENGEEANRVMTEKYFLQLEKLRNIHIDIAFVPMDSRQGKYAFAGLESFLQYTDSKKVFPMHLWDNYELINKFLAKYPQYEKRVMVTADVGQQFVLNNTIRKSHV